MSEQEGSLGSSPRAVAVEWVRQLMQKKKWTGSELARHAGLTPSTILRLLNDPAHRFVPSLRTLQKISSASGQPIPRKVLHAIGAARSEASQLRGLDNQALASPARVREMVRLRHLSSLPAGLQSERGEVLIACPPQLEGDETAFACYTPDDALEPWIRSGSLLFGTRRRDPIKHDLVLLTDEEGRSKVRLLLEQDERSLTVASSTGDREIIPLDALADLALISLIVRT